MFDIDYRKVSVSLTQKNNMLFYEIKNPCMELPHKKEGEYRGYGLKNVKACVQRHGGSMEQWNKDGRYCVSIRLNCPSNRKLSRVY